MVDTWPTSPLDQPMRRNLSADGQRPAAAARGCEEPNPTGAEVPMRTQIRALALALALVLGAAACGSSAPKGDADTKGQRAQAIDELHRYGLTKEQAAC